MFSEELNKLIEASLVDGVITDKEKAVIKKRALLEGVDPDEVDMMLDAELQKIMQKQQEAVNKVKKCPNCGEVIPAMTVVCPRCGYEYRDIGANGSAVKLADMLTAETSPSKKIEIIQSFPIPNSREDIFELLTLAISNSPKVSIDNDRIIENENEKKTYGFWESDESRSKQVHVNDIAEAWQRKYQQIIMKAKLVLKSPEDLKTIENYEKKYKKISRKNFFHSFSFFILCILGLFCMSMLMVYLLDNEQKNSTETTDAFVAIDSAAVDSAVIDTIDLFK